MAHVCLQVFNIHGINPSDLKGASRDHFSTQYDDDFVTSDGTVFDKNQQADILSEAQSAYFLTLVVCQMATAYVMKVRGKERNASALTRHFFRGQTTVLRNGTGPPLNQNCL